MINGKDMSQEELYEFSKTFDDNTMAYLVGSYVENSRVAEWGFRIAANNNWLCTGSVKFTKVKES